MSNTFSPFGFSQIGNGDGVSANFGMIQRPVSNNSTAIYKGDPVAQLSTGYVTQWTASTNVSQLVGIFAGCQYQSPTQGLVRSPYWPSGTVTGDVTAFIIPCQIGGATPGVFLVQSTNSVTNSTAVGKTNIGQNVDVTLGTGSTVTGLSGAAIDMGTAANSSSLPFRIIGLYSSTASAFAPYGGSGNGSDTASANNYVIVQANLFQATGI